MTGRARVVMPPVLLALVLLGIWQLLVSALHVPPYIAPAPGAVAAQFADSFSLLRSATVVTGTNALIGGVVGTVLASLIALVVHRWRGVDRVVGSIASGAAAVPIVALAPLFYAMYSDIAESSRQIVVTLVVFFPIYVSVSRGLREILQIHADIMRVNDASRRDVARHLDIPSAAPYLFGGLRIAAPAAVISSLVTEYFGGPQNGLAVLISSAAQATDFAQAWAFVFASVLLGLVAFAATSGLEALVRSKLGAVS